MPALVEGCDLILGNEEDAEKVFGIRPEGFDATATEGHVEADAFRSVCSQLMARFPRAKKVVITLRGSINANHNTWGGVLRCPRSGRIPPPGRASPQSIAWVAATPSWAACSMA